MTRDFQYLPLRHVAAVKNSNVDKLSLPGESPVRLCNYVDVYRNDRITQAVSFMRASATPTEIASFKLRLGDVLITKDSEQWNDIGVPALVATEGDDLVCGYHLTMLRPHSSKILGSYLAYALRVPEVAVQLHLAAKGVTRYGLSQQGIKSAQVPVPPLEEQGLIVRYLDYAELRIAKAIAAKQRMIKLLEEKKQVVAEEIILGRDQSGVEFLDSEVPWLGQVPKHWELSPCRAYLRRRKVLVGRGHGGHVLLSLTLRGLIVRDLSQMKGKFPASFESYQRVEPGDFVFCLFDVDETPRTVGLARVGGMITGAYDVFECADESIREYLYEYFLTIDRGKKLKPLYRGLRKTVPSNAFASMRIPIPPVAERDALVRKLKASTAAVDAAIESLMNEVVLLKEYRTRLISDVVTGKLDVREEATKLPEIDPMELATVSVGENGDDEEETDGD
jgi:type I restriction enzyme S subunit